MDNWHACHQCPGAGVLMTAKLHLAPGMHLPTSEHQTVLSSVNLIALDTDLLARSGPKRDGEGKAKPDFLCHIGFSSVSHALTRTLGRRGVRYLPFRNSAEEVLLWPFSNLKTTEVSDLLTVLETAFHFAFQHKKWWNKGATHLSETSEVKMKMHSEIRPFRCTTVDCCDHYFNSSVLVYAAVTGV